LFGEGASPARAAELLGLTLWDLPALLAEYRMPRCDSSPEDLERDVQTLCDRQQP